MHKKFSPANLRLFECCVPSAGDTPTAFRSILRPWENRHLWELLHKHPILALSPWSWSCRKDAIWGTLGILLHLLWGKFPIDVLVGIYWGANLQQEVQLIKGLQNCYSKSNICVLGLCISPSSKCLHNGWSGINIIRI